MPPTLNCDGDGDGDGDPTASVVGGPSVRVLLVVGVIEEVLWSVVAVAIVVVAVVFGAVVVVVVRVVDGGCVVADVDVGFVEGALAGVDASSSSSSHPHALQSCPVNSRMARQVCMIGIASTHEYALSGNGAVHATGSDVGEVDVDDVVDAIVGV